ARTTGNFLFGPVADARAVTSWPIAISETVKNASASNAFFMSIPPDYRIWGRNHGFECGKNIYSFALRLPKYCAERLTLENRRHQGGLTVRSRHDLPGFARVIKLLAHSARRASQKRNWRTQSSGQLPTCSILHRIASLNTSQVRCPRLPRNDGQAGDCPVRDCSPSVKRAMRIKAL